MVLARSRQVIRQGLAGVSGDAEAVQEPPPAG
jgi:hypothetical protein